MTKLTFGKPKWTNTGDREWQMSGVFYRYTLSEHNDKFWHVAVVGAGTGFVIDKFNKVNTLEQAKEYVYKLTCDYLQSKYEASFKFIEDMEKING
jgi:hypothetical protein